MKIFEIGHVFELVSALLRIPLGLFSETEIIEFLLIFAAVSILGTILYRLKRRFL